MIAVIKRRAGRWALNAAATVGLLYILRPLIFVTWLSFFRQEIPSFPPEGYSIKWYVAAANDARMVDGFLLSLQLGLIATALGLLVGVPAAVCLSRFQFIGREAISSLLLAPLMVPGVVLGIALYVFQVELEIATGLPILGSLIGLVIGHILIA